MARFFVSLMLVSMALGIMSLAVGIHISFLYGLLVGLTLHLAQYIVTTRPANPVSVLYGVWGFQVVKLVLFILITTGFILLAQIEVVSYLIGYTCLAFASSLSAAEFHKLRSS